MKTLLIITVIFLTTSCANSTSEKAQVPKEEKKNIQPQEVVFYDYSNVTFDNPFSDSTTHIFSDLYNPNKFKIFVPKGKIMETISFLLVTESNGDTLHLETFKTWEIIYGYALDQMTSDKEVVNHMKERVSQNLNESSFINLSESDLNVFADSEPESYENYETFIHCKSNNLPIYHFVLWNENGTFFGYSEKELKAVPILYCC